MTQETLQTPTPEQQAGYPADLTEAEFLQFSMSVARRMGPLKTQKPLMILFGVYFIISVVGCVMDFAETGTVSLFMLAMTGLTILSAVLSLTIMPARIRKGAKASYKTGNLNGYYGEITVTPHAIMKYIGEETVTIPFTPQTLYIEERDFMSFTIAGQQRSIILPARCMTHDMASQVRKAVFAQNVQMDRRVFARMEALASQPIEKRAFPDAATTLVQLDFQYTPEEAAALHATLVWKRYFTSLPGFSMLSILIGLLLAFLEENLLWFPGVSLAMILGYLLLTLFRSKKGGAAAVRTRLTLTDNGIKAAFSPSGLRQTIGWQGVERAIEREDAVEFIYGGGHLLRIPKRVIDDLDELRRVVDDHIHKDN